MKNKIEQTFTISIFLLLCLSLLYYKFILSSQLSEISRLKSEFTAKSDFVNQLSQLKSNKEKTLKDLEDSKYKLKTLEVRIPKQVNSGEFNLDLYRELKERQLNIKNISTIQSSNSSEHCSDTIDIIVDGPKQKCLDFVKHLQDNKRTIKLNEVKITNLNPEQISLNIGLNIYAIK